MKNNILEKNIILFGLTIGISSYLIWIGGLSGHLIGAIYFAAIFLCLGIVYPLSRLVLFFIKKKGYNRFFFAAFLTLTIAYFVAVFSPTLEIDSLAYHLYLPKLFLRIKNISFLPYNGNVLFPSLVENLFFIGIYFKNLTLCKIINFSIGIFLAFTAGLFASSLIGEKKSFIFTTLTVFSIPGIIFNSSICYNDIGMAFFALLSIYFFIKWVVTRGKYYFYLMSVFSGLVISTKYTGLFIPLILTIMLAYDSFISKERFYTFIKKYVLYLLISFLCGGWWYLRAFIITSNPFYPYLYKFFGPEGWFSDVAEKIGLGKGLWQYLGGFWNMSIYPDSFGGGANQFGILLLCFLPLIFLIWRKLSLKQKHIFGLLGFFCLSYYTLWFIVGQNLRFLYILAVIFCITIGVTIAKVWQERAFLANIIKVLFCFLLFINISLCLYYQSKKSIGFIRPGGHVNILEKNRTYAISKWVNNNVSLHSKMLVCGEPAVFYFDPLLVRELPFRYITQYGKDNLTELQMLGLIRAHDFSHVIFRKWISLDDKNMTVYPPGTLPGSIEKEKPFFLELLHMEKFQDEQLGFFEYYVYKIKEDTKPESKQKNENTRSQRTQ